MKKKLLLLLLFCGFFLTSHAQWTLQASAFPTANRGIKYIHAVDTNVVWATGYDGSVASAPEIQEFTRTTNGGAKWKARSITGYSGDGLSMIYAIDSMNAWIPVWYTAGGGTIIHTTNGGYTWTPQSTATFTAPAGFPNVIHFWDVNEGFCMGDPNGGYFEIYTTVNGGTTWTRVPQANIPASYTNEYGTTGMYCIVGDIIWFTTGKGRVYKSIDRGHHWTVSATPNTTSQLEISFRDINHGIVQANTTPYPAYYTSDGGTTWQTLTSTGNFYRSGFCYVPGTTSTYVSAGSDYTTPYMGTSYSTDDGVNWTTITDLYQFLGVSFVDSRHGWAGAFNTDSLTGGIWKYTGNLFVFDSCAGLAAFFSKSADTVDLNTSGLINFTNLSSGTYNGRHWDFGDGGNSTQQNPGHTYASTGKFAVTLTVTYGTCSSTKTDTVVVINTSGIEKYSEGPAIEIWPNPAKDHLHIASVAPVSKIEIFNSLGQIAYNANNNKTSMDINISEFQPGIYYIRIFTERGRSEGKFIVAK